MLVLVLMDPTKERLMDKSELLTSLCGRYALSMQRSSETKFFGVLIVYSLSFMTFAPHIGQLSLSCVPTCAWCPPHWF